jgi:hypothetical protein
VGERAYALETGVEGPTERTPALDHTCYPHILDRVLALAPWDSLLRFRSVSRALKERADAALFRHVVVLPGSLPYILYVRGAGGRLPAVAALDACTDGLVDSSARPLFAHTRVLDIHNPIEHGICALVTKLAPNLRAVRKLSCRNSQLMDSDAEVHYKPLGFFEPNSRNHVHFVAPFRLSRAKLVVNHLYDAVCPTASEMPSVSSVRGQPVEVVLVFSPFVFPSSAPARPAAEFLDELVAYLVSALNRRRIGRESAKLTLVGVGEMAAAAVSGAEEAAVGETTTGAAARRALLDPAALADGRLATMLLQRAFNERGTEWRVPERGDAAEHLRFLSRDEYITPDTYWEVEAPELAAMYAAGWTPAR